MSYIHVLRDIKIMRKPPGPLTSPTNCRRTSHVDCQTHRNPDVFQLLRTYLLLARDDTDISFTPFTLLTPHFLFHDSHPRCFRLQLFLLPSGVQINNDDMAKSFPHVPPLQNNINVLIFCGFGKLFTIEFQANTLAVSSLSRGCEN